MALRYEEWLPDATGLQDVITAYWYVSGDGSNAPSSAVLPDGHVELVFHAGDAVDLEGPAYAGTQPARAVVGPLSQAIRLQYRGVVDTFGIRFHPARGAAFFGRTSSSLVDKLLVLADVSSELDLAFSGLMGAWSPENRSWRAAIDRVLLDHLACTLPADMAVVAMVDRITRSDPIPTVEQIADELGLSTRQAQRRFVRAVGMPPKKFVRVLRFSRLWQTASMGSPETWASLAADHGYADQAHMAREFRAFGVEPPSHFFSSDWYDATTLARISGPAQGERRSRHVRSVQDRAASR